jgi:hypothetical protein
MSTHMHTLYSDRIKGIGVHQGGPYKSSWTQGITVEEHAALSVAEAQARMDDNTIPDLANFQNAPVYVITGELDEIVKPMLGESTKLFYENFGANVVLEEMEGVIHQFPTDLPAEAKPLGEKGGTVRNTFPNCGIDTAGKILSHLLVNMPGSTIDALNPKDDDWQSNGVLRLF